MGEESNGPRRPQGNDDSGKRPECLRNSGVCNANENTELQDPLDLGSKVMETGQTGKG